MLFHTRRAVLLAVRATQQPLRSFSATQARHAKNKIFPNSVRNENELTTLILMSASTRRPILTLWKTDWCQSCKIVSPIIRELIESEGVGEEQGGVDYAEVDMDSPDLGGVSGIAMRYMINSMPTLLAFDRQEPQLETKVSRLDDLKSKDFLRKWIVQEAGRRGEGGAGGGGLFGLFKR